MSDDDDGWAVGALLGFLFGGPVGGFVGAVLGAAADEACQPPDAPRSSGPHHSNTTTGTSQGHHQKNQSSHTGYQRPRAEAWVNSVPSLPTAVDNALQALGLRPGVTLDAVKRRYHELGRRYHPDLYEAAGTDPRLRVEAQERFVRIRQAYELINQYVVDRR